MRYAPKRAGKGGAVRVLPTPLVTLPPAKKTRSGSPLAARSSAARSRERSPRCCVPRRRPSIGSLKSQCLSTQGCMGPPSTLNALLAAAATAALSSATFFSALSCSTCFASCCCCCCLASASPHCTPAPPCCCCSPAFSAVSCSMRCCWASHDGSHCWGGWARCGSARWRQGGRAGRGRGGAHVSAR